MKYIIIILISLFISLPSLANPSGKGLICECVNCEDINNKRKIGFIFFDDSVKRYMFDDIKDIIKINESGGYFYTTSPDDIRFKVGSYGTTYLLKRKSLKLKAVTHLELESTYQCKVMVGEDEFIKEIDNLQKSYQRELDLILKDNKI